MINLNFIANKISKIATFSMIIEASVSPKPGLVDLINSGSHLDMDYLTFIKSSICLNEYFKKALILGIEEYEKKDFLSLRNLGKHYEDVMYFYTNGANTHKGTIFSLGLFVYATGNLIKKNSLSSKNIINRVSFLARDITKELDTTKDISSGVLQYKKYNLKGVREEAESGFSKALNGLSILKDSLKSLDLNDSLIEVLFYYFSNVEDSNVIKRSGFSGLNFVKECAKKAKEKSFMRSSYGREYIYSLNEEFVKKNISSGGAADFLILTIYLYLLERDYVGI